MWPLKECVEQINRVGGQPPPLGIGSRWKTVTEREWYVLWGLILASAQYSAVRCGPQPVGQRAQGGAVQVDTIKTRVESAYGFCA